MRAPRPAVVALLVAACSSGGTDADVTDTDVTELLEGGAWRLDSYVDDGATGSVPPELRPPTLLFEAGVATVDTGCNTGSVDHRTTGTAVTFESLVITEIACGSDASSVEQAIVDTLQGETAVAVSADELVIDRGEHRLVYVVD